MAKALRKTDTDSVRTTAPSNPLGTDGFEFVEYTAQDSQALGELFHQMGFTLIAQHRSKAVDLYRQGSINFIVNYRKQLGDQIRDKGLDQVIEQLRMRRRCATRSKIVWCSHKPFAEMMLPYPVHNDASGKRVRRIDNRLCQFETSLSRREMLQIRST